MNINVLNANFELIAIVDTYQSLIWCKRYNDIGALDLQIEATNQTLSIFKKGNYITRDDDDAVFRIEALELDTNADKDNSLIVGAYDIKKILEQRIVYETENYNTTVENTIRGLIENNFINPTDSLRKINNFALKNAKGFSETLITQITYEVIGEKIMSLCKAHNYGYKITLENGILYFDLYRGKDKSSNQNVNVPVIFSTEYDNLISSKYELDISDIKNVALVGGEGEGKDRVKKEVGSGTGLNRFEMFVDSSGVSSDGGEIPLNEYYEMLIENGYEQLAQKSVSTSFEAIVDTGLYEYKKDFDLGDIVTLENEYGIKVDARIIEIIETWNDSGYSLEPKFEYMEVADIDYEEIPNVLTTETSVAMMSENNVALLSEEATEEENGIKISQLRETTVLKDGCCIPIVQDGETKKIYFGNIVPVGTIFPCVSNNIPASWLLCNGSTYDIETYPKLYEILGTDVLPDLKGRFLQGANENLGQNIEAGLPNITGNFEAQSYTVGSNASGAFKTISRNHVDSGTSQSNQYQQGVSFDASRSSSIYGKSNTVQPPAYTVNYIIKAT